MVNGVVGGAVVEVDRRESESKGMRRLLSLRFGSPWCRHVRVVVRR
jgi:hypothetical protein